MRKILSGFFLALLCFANTGAFEGLVLERKIAVKTTRGIASYANVRLIISESDQSTLLAYSAGFLPTEIPAGSDFSLTLTPISCCPRLKAGQDCARGANMYPDQERVFLYRAKPIDFCTGHSGVVITA